MSRQPNQNKSGLVAALAIAITTASTLAAQASPLNMKMLRANYPAWTSLEECQKAQPGQGCESTASICFGFPIYTTAHISETLTASIGQKDSTVEIYAVNVDSLAPDHANGLICTVR